MALLVHGSQQVTPECHLHIGCPSNGQSLEALQVLKITTAQHLVACFECIFANAAYAKPSTMSL